MILEVLASYKDIIEVDEHKGDITKDAIHQSSEDLCSILEAEGHTDKFP